MERSYSSHCIRSKQKYATENYRLMQDLENFRSQSIKETTHTKKHTNRKRKNN